MFTVRAAAAADVPAVLPMVRAICAQHETWDAARYPMRGDVVAMYERWLPLRAADPRSVFLVAEQGGALAGFLVATVEANIPIYTLAEFGFIHDLWVEPAQRGQGLGGALVEEALRRFRAIGVTQVRLETAAANDTARRLFDSRGFRVGTIDMLRTL
jgi:ribosomal protein S18 acetylase RimI-like enzyme